jgi:hypothetical protein
MRLVLLITGVLVDSLGILWILQGLNVLPGSRMSGETFWAGAGVVALILGAGLVAGARRRKV